MLPKKLNEKLAKRITEASLRSLSDTHNLIDFSSNDYLGFCTSEEIFNRTFQFLKKYNLEVNGASGSRLLTGNHKLFNETESVVAKFHQCEAALIFNSGYDANIGLLASVPQRGDLIIYDALCHASIRDGLTLSAAKNTKFKHNDLHDLERCLQRNIENYKQGAIYVVTESVFSMDGDVPDLITMTQLCASYNTKLIIDEAHAVGVMGRGHGLVQELGLENQVFARVVTFGKALGCHGAAVLGSKELKQYLVNFSRSFIYTTGLPPHSVATIKMAYEQLSQIAQQGNNNLQKLHNNIVILQLDIIENNLADYFIPSESAIHCCIISGNEKVKAASMYLRNKGFDVKPILSPTVPKGEERLRICLHSYNTSEEIHQLLHHIATFVL